MARFDDENQNPSASGSQGRKRSRELAAEMKTAVAGVVEAMLAGLGRPATEVDKMDAEALAALLLRARRLRDNGRDDTAVLIQFATLKRDTAFHRPYPPAPTA